jgi:HD-like signal output (HDOD) protein
MRVFCVASFGGKERMTMEKGTLLCELEKIENLPTLPIVVQQIQKLIASPNSNMVQIAAIVTRDQAIAARVIRLINSAFYGLGGKVASVQQAIVLLGLNTVKNLILGVSVVKIFEDSNGKASLYNREKFWMHAFACALGAKMIAKKINIREPEDFFLAGLMHDIGILVLDQFFHQDFIGVIQDAAGRKIDYVNAEQDRLGLTHGEIGEFMGRKWKIPEFLIHSMRYHHQPLFAGRELASSIQVIAAVHVSDVMAENRGIDMGYRNGTKSCQEPALKCIGLSLSEIDAVFDDVEKEVKSTAKEWGV